MTLDVFSCMQNSWGAYQHLGFRRVATVQTPADIKYGAVQVYDRNLGTWGPCATYANERAALYFYARRPGALSL